MSIHDMSGLCPDDPASLAELIALHREMFGGWRMEAGATPPEPPPPPPAPPAPIPPAPPTPPHAGGDGPLGEPGLKALQAERDARAKAEKDLAALRKQIEDAAKTAEQKAADDLAAARTEAASAAKALRYEVAAAKGLDLALASRLAGTTRAELEADAEALKLLLGNTASKPGVSRGWRHRHFDHLDVSHGPPGGGRDRRR